MKLKSIAISLGNYEALRNFGKTGMSFNDVISELIKTRAEAWKPHSDRITTCQPRPIDRGVKMRSEQYHI